jgi:hypothetical protein
MGMPIPEGCTIYACSPALRRLSMSSTTFESAAHSSVNMVVGNMQLHVDGVKNTLSKAYLGATGASWSRRPPRRPISDHQDTGGEVMVISLVILLTIIAGGRRRSGELDEVVGVPLPPSPPTSPIYLACRPEKKV